MPAAETGPFHPANRLSGPAKITLIVLTLTILVLKGLAIRSLRVDSDEPQHAHVVWAIANGQLPYRDVFDNHVPLFQYLCAPYFALFGENPLILLPLRAVMLLPYAGCLWAIFKIADLLYSRPAAWMAALLAGIIPSYFFTSTEFRPDGLWAMSWLFTLLVAMGGPLTGRKAFAVGLLLGCTAGISIKTVLLGPTLAVSALVAFLIYILDQKKAPGPGAIAYRLLLLGAGAAIIPTIITLFFLERGAFANFFYCIYQHNAMAGLKRWKRLSTLGLLFPAALPFMVAFAYGTYRQAQGPVLGAKRAFIAIIPLVYLALMFSYMPDITRQDDLPYVPLLPLTVLPLVLLGWRICRRPNLEPYLLTIILPVLFLGETIWVCETHNLRQRGLRKMAEAITDVLKLTKPGEMVMDDKGEYVFRPRAFYWLNETLTRARISRGLIKDKILLTRKSCTI